ncbi:MAG: diguanylate cyclase [Bacillota bacterium]
MVGQTFMSFIKRLTNRIKTYHMDTTMDEMNRGCELDALMHETDIRLKLGEDIACVGYWEWDHGVDQIIIYGDATGFFRTEGEIYHTTYRSFVESFVHPDNRKLVQKSVRNMIHKDIADMIEIKILKSNGEEGWARLKAQAMRNERGEIRKIIGVVQDITEWKRIEQANMEKLDFINKFFETIPNPLFYKDIHGVYKHCNQAFASYLGRRKEEILGHTTFEIHPSDLAVLYHKADQELIQSQGTKISEASILCHDGFIHNVIINKAALIDAKGNVDGIVGTLNDITERKKDEWRINRLLKLKEAMLEVNHAVIQTEDLYELFQIILDKALEVIEKADLGAILVFDEDENLRIVVSKGYNDPNIDAFRLSLKKSFIWLETEGKIEKTVIVNDIPRMLKRGMTKLPKDDLGIEVLSSISAPIFMDGRLYGLIGIDSRFNHAYDETDLEIMEYMRNQVAIAIGNHKLYEEMIYLSKYDSLTNTYNRRYFEEFFEKYLSSKVETTDCFSFVVFDLDDLKFVNDTYGHLAGDELIKVFAKTMKDTVESLQAFARYGGDEFVGILYGSSSMEFTDQFEELSAFFRENPIKYKSYPIICRFSYGIANYPTDGKDYDQLIKVADERMYNYKRKNPKPA